MVTATRFRTQYDDNYKSEVFNTDVGEIDEDYQVQQHMAAACDINNIMANYVATGELTHINGAAATYGDFSEVLDYREGLHQIQAAGEMFMELPAKVRDRFDNDPAKFLDFATNPDNIEDMRSMGLAPALPPKPEAPITRKDLEEVLAPQGGKKRTPDGETS